MSTFVPRRSKQCMLNTTAEAYRNVLLLRNGFVSKEKGTSIQSYNTCPFDSVFNVMAALYIDFEEVRASFDESNCEFTRIRIQQYAFNNTQTVAIKQNALLRQRNQILQNIFQGTDKISKFENGLISIDCNANVNYLLPKVLPVDLYSYSRESSCGQCAKVTSSHRCFVDINMELLEQKGVQNLNSCLLETLISEVPSTCSCGSPTS